MTGVIEDGDFGVAKGSAEILDGIAELLAGDIQTLDDGEAEEAEDAGHGTGVILGISQAAKLSLVATIADDEGGAEFAGRLGGLRGGAEADRNRQATGKEQESAHGGGYCRESNLPHNLKIH